MPDPAPSGPAPSDPAPTDTSPTDTAPTGTAPTDTAPPSAGPRAPGESADAPGRRQGLWGGWVLAGSIVVEAGGLALVGARASASLGLGWGLRGGTAQAAADRSVLLVLGLVLALAVLAVAAAVVGVGPSQRWQGRALVLAATAQVPLLVSGVLASVPVAAVIPALALVVALVLARRAARASGGGGGAAGLMGLSGALAGAGAVLLSVVVVPVTLARLVGVDAVTPFAQAVALTPLVGAAAVLALVLAVAAAALRGSGRTSRGDPAGPTPHRRGRAGRGRVGPRHALRGWAPVVVLAVVVALHASWLAPRWFEGPRGGDASTTAGAPLVVATVNAQLGAADPDAVLALVTEHDVEVLVLVELTPSLVDALDAAGLGEVLPERDVLPGGGPSGSGVWSRLPLDAQPAVAGTTNAAPRVAVEVADGVQVEVVAAHPYPPIPGGVGSWTSDLRLFADAVGRGSGSAEDGSDADGTAGVAGGTVAGTVVLGDFNATRDHAAFRALLKTAGLRDAADVLGTGWSPTWPVRGDLPRFLELDHVLLSDAIAVDSLVRVTVPGTDHQGLVATLRVT